MFNDIRRGIGSWSTNDVMTYLKTGHNRFAAANGPMALVITGSTSKLSYDDLDAIAAILNKSAAITIYAGAGCAGARGSPGRPA